MKVYLAECLGTFVLVLIGCGSAVLAADHIGYAGVSAAFGFALVAMIYAVGPISSCHLNPAVTFGMTLSGKFPARRAFGYVAAQVLGAVLASAVLYVIASGTVHFDPAVAGFASNGYGERSPGHYGMAAAFTCETVMTLILVVTILGATDIKAPVGFAGIAIGLVLAGIHLMSIPVTNTSVNPARSIGPAIFVGWAAIQQLWLFMTAPFLGGALASLVYRWLRPIEPVAQLAVMHAVQGLPTEQKQRLAKALGEVPNPSASLEAP